MHLELGLSAREQRVIVTAALLAHEGRHAEAECARFAAGYHNLKEVTIARLVPPPNVRQHTRFIETVDAHVYCEECYEDIAPDDDLKLRASRRLDSGRCACCGSED